MIDMNEELCEDSFSNHSCKNEVTDDDSSDEEIVWRPWIFFQPSISDDSDFEEEWSSVDNPAILEEFLGHSGINTENILDSVANAVAIFIEYDFFTFLVHHPPIVRIWHENTHLRCK